MKWFQCIFSKTTYFWLSFPGTNQRYQMHLLTPCPHFRLSERWVWKLFVVHTPRSVTALPWERYLSKRKEICVSTIIFGGELLNFGCVMETCTASRTSPPAYYWLDQDRSSTYDSIKWMILLLLSKVVFFWVTMLIVIQLGEPHWFSNS